TCASLTWTRSRASRIERRGGLDRFPRSRIHLVDRPERVGQQAAHELEPLLGDLAARRSHTVAELFQGHTSPPVCGRIPRPRSQRGGGFMTRAYRFLGPMVLLSAVWSWAPPPALAQGNLNVYCSVQAEWCQAVANEFQRQTGIRVGLTLKGSGETLAQVTAEAANPKGDVWFGGTGDPHLAAAEQNLTLAYKSPNLDRLHDWARRQAEEAGFKTVGIYAGALGFGYNPELLQRKKLAPPTCWRDLVKPEYRDEIQVANPNSWGHLCTAGRGVGPLLGRAGFPVKIQARCEGTGDEVGSLSIIKGARNLEGAKKFVDWALTAPAQKLGAESKQFRAPSTRAAQLPPQAPRFADVKLINYDFAKYGSSAERKRLLDRWEKEVNSQAK